MKRSGGVIASAVIAIIGSLLTLLFGVSMVLNGIFMRSNPDLLSRAGNMPMSASTLVTVVLIEAIFFLGLGVIGIVCSIGLLRLKNWARVSFLIFAGLLSVFSIFGALGIAIALVATPSFIPPQPEVPQGLIRGAMAAVLGFELILAALGAAWLVYFSRGRVREMFLGEEAASVPRRGPISVTIIAWILVVSGSLSLLYVPLSLPAMVLGIVLHGWAARIMFALFAAISLGAGIGILRWRPKAHLLALSFYVFGLINTLSFLIPGSLERTLAAMQEFLPQSPVQRMDLQPFLWMGILGGSVTGCVFIWFLVTRRRAFLEACQHGPGATPPLSAPSQ